MRLSIVGTLVPRLSGGCRALASARGFPLTCLFGFALLVMAGISGHSLRAFDAFGPLVEQQDRPVAGKARPVRSDEWGVITPMAIAQTLAHPVFPVVNPALGPDGHNMLVVGMTGVPIAHPSALARPATWGFFFLDLRRALAWSWWTPLLIAALAITGLGRLIWPNRPGQGIGAAALILTAPYISAWSYWPAYALAFPAAALALALCIARGSAGRYTAWLGLPLGLCFAGFFFLLYPPWQIALGTLFALLGLALVIQEGRSWRWNASKGLAMVLALGITASLILAWWMDARDAVLALADTVYPGRRTTLTGGGYSLAILLRGFAGLSSMYATDFSGTPGNASEFASFHYLGFPIVVLLIWRFQSWRRDPIVWALIGFVVWCLVYSFIGVPVELARLTTWGRVPSIRADLALGVAYILLCVHLLALGGEHQGPSVAQRAAAVVATLAWAWVVVSAVAVWPEAARGAASSWRTAATMVLASGAGLYLAWGRPRAHLAFACGLGALTIAAFHPLAVAPRVISTPLAADQKARIAVVGPHFPAMALLAAGLPIVNGIHYVPQAGIWRTLDPQSRFRDTWNRYQHLVFELDPTLAPSDVGIDSRSADQVNVRVHPTGFDWGRVGAARVLAPTAFDSMLMKHPGLVRLPAAVAGWSYWAVREPSAATGR